MTISASPARGPIRALLFDKDGTLFDFEKTWAPFALRVVEQLGAGEPRRMRALADAIGVDLGDGRFTPHSPVIAGSTRDVVAALLSHLPEWRGEDLALWLDREAQSVGPRSLAPASSALGALLLGLKRAGFALGVATNDSARSAQLQLEAAGVVAHFDFVAGYDSVAQPKPAPDMIHAFAARVDAPVERIAMIGDSTHDLFAARAAGCGAAIAVLTGPATEAILAPHADIVLPSIDALPVWLSAGGGAL